MPEKLVEPQRRWSNKVQEPKDRQNRSVTNVETAFQRFRTALNLVQTSYPIEIIGPEMIVVGTTPTTGTAAGRDSKDIELTFGGIVHGNETAGIEVLTRLLEDLTHHSVLLTKKIGFFLGNPEAALAGQRFIERDLNRSFGMKVPAGSREGVRAAELEKLLERTRYLLDFHQTREPAATPFFIFPYQLRSFNFARQISSALPIVTHWGASFSKDGMCSDEFVNKAGGTGITIELGQCGFDEHQIAGGLDAARSALVALECVEARPTEWTLSRIAPASVATEFSGAVFTWSDIVPYPPTGIVELTPGLINFKSIEKQMVIGHHDNKPIMAPSTGHILFPKYVRPGTVDAKLPRPAELCRFMKRISLEDLPL